MIHFLHINLENLKIDLTVSLKLNFPYLEGMPGISCRPNRTPVSWSLPKLVDVLPGGILKTHPNTLRVISVRTLFIKHGRVDSSLIIERTNKMLNVAQINVFAYVVPNPFAIIDKSKSVQVQGCIKIERTVCRMHNSAVGMSTFTFTQSGRLVICITIEKKTYTRRGGLCNL